MRRTVSPQRERDITESIARLRGTLIAIDCRKEANRLKGASGKTLERLSNVHPFLSVAPSDRDGLVVGGEHPLPLWRYAELRHHMIAVPSWLLSVEAPRKGKRGFRFSDDNILLTHYLIMRAERLRSPQNQQRNSHVAFTRKTTEDSDGTAQQGGILAALGWDARGRDRAEVRRKVSSARKTAQEVLGFFEREGYIDGYVLEDNHILLKTVHNPWEI